VQRNAIRRFQGRQFMKDSIIENNLIGKGMELVHVGCA